MIRGDETDEVIRPLRRKEHDISAVVERIDWLVAGFKGLSEKVDDLKTTSDERTGADKSFDRTVKVYAVVVPVLLFLGNVALHYLK